MTGRRAELILYATPEGSFADTCRELWHLVERTGMATTAQTYPPHCTLTGFFRRHPDRLPRVVDEAAAVFAELTVPEDPVQSMQLLVTEHWVGYELTAPWFVEVTKALVGGHEVAPGEDPLRPKSWLHLSLAYGDGFDPGLHARLVEERFAPSPHVDWSLGLWRRCGTVWELLQDCTL